LYIGANKAFHAGNLSPNTFALSANVYDKTQTYTKTEVDTAVSNAGDIRAANANIFKNTNTFNNAGLAIKIQPSANVAGTTKLIQTLSSDGLTEVFSVDASGNVTVRGNLNVSGSTVQLSTQNINGDMAVTGNLSVSGNTVLGDATTDTITMNGIVTLASGSVLKQVGVYNEVMRFPVFGIGGDLQFQTDSTTYDNIIDHYWTFSSTNSCLPAVASGASRYYKLLISYGDNGASGTSTLNLVQNGTSTAITTVTLPNVFGDAVGSVRTFLSPAFQTSYTNHTTFQAKRDTAVGSLVIKYIEVIAYDVY
jgi:hypothetical protein